MGHAITVGDMLLSLGAIGGAFVSFGAGVAMLAQGMSDAPDDSGPSGCIVLVAGLVAAISCIVGLVAF